MSSRIAVVVAATPINTIPAQTNDYETHDMVDAQVGGTLAGSFTINVEGEMVEVGSLEGYVYSKTNRYAKLTTTPLAFADCASPQALFVRNPGKLFTTTSGMGATAAYNVAVAIDGVRLVTLAPQEAIVFPLHPETYPYGQFNGSRITLAQLGADGVEIAVEALLLK
jgi:hypothetical protein